MSPKAPGFVENPGHSVDLEACPARMRASFGDTVLAESSHAICLREGRYDPVIYFPRKDVNGQHLVKTEHSTYCPFKGHASYWTITGTNGKPELAANAAWGYEAPYDECLSIEGHVAFYQDRVSVAESP